jgi:hypothetical protein
VFLEFGWELYRQKNGFIIGTVWLETLSTNNWVYNWNKLQDFAFVLLNEVLLNEVEGLVKIRIKHAYPELSISFMIILMF